MTGDSRDTGLARPFVTITSALSLGASLLFHFILVVSTRVRNLPHLALAAGLRCVQVDRWVQAEGKSSQL
jgi:hypothetical protein